MGQTADRPVISRLNCTSRRAFGKWLAFLETGILYGGPKNTVKGDLSIEIRNCLPRIERGE